MHIKFDMVLVSVATESIFFHNQDRVIYFCPRSRAATNGSQWHEYRLYREIKKIQWMSCCRVHLMIR